MMQVSDATHVMEIGRMRLSHLAVGFAIRGGDGNTPPPFMPGNAGFLLAGKFACFSRNKLPLTDTIHSGLYG